MQGKVYIFHPSTPDGVAETHILKKTPDLEYLRGAVGGHIEMVPYFSTYNTGTEIVGCVVFCNEEGKLHNLPVNIEATRQWDRALRRIVRGDRRLYPTGIFDPKTGDPSDVLVGSIIVVTGDNEFMGDL
jgi:hypothetical protein